MAGVLNSVSVEWSSDGVNWHPIYQVATGVLGVTADFVHWIPPGPGTYAFRCVATCDPSNGVVGRTSLVTLATNR